MPLMQSAMGVGAAAPELRQPQPVNARSGGPRTLIPRRPAAPFPSPFPVPRSLWIINVYTPALAALLLPLGAIGDRLGRKPMPIGGLTVFGIASAVEGPRRLASPHHG
ncbi:MULTISPECIES: hypothetical protein [Streptomyces]|uniref:hypothetical protein n=1 Tax=Streptomyces sp. NPDC005386 TaxID=3154562 RepID=UPI0033A5B3B9